MQIQIIQVPYDSGYREQRQGCGPGRLMAEGVERVLAADGHDISVSRVESKERFTTEISTAIELNRTLSGQVGAAVEKGRFPLVLAGNCNTCLGSIGGIGPRNLGVVWFDAHGEFNTPETTLSGFLDGMPLAMATGRCWKSLLKTIPGFEPVPESNILLVGAKDLDLAEKEMFAQSDITVVQSEPFDRETVVAAIEKSLTEWRQRVEAIYLHIDLDILDYGGVYANHLKIGGGLSPAFLKEAISLIKKHATIKACTMASYDPANDADGRIAATGIELLRQVAGV